ncbi:MAG: hypothetical protein OEO77_07720, partial [Acidimicrobiia bacterium]|nr:hypothetical protein [Acidimicrobiia bacterium]
IFLVAGGAFVSIRASSNLASLGTSGLALALLAAPMALPGAVVRGPVGNALHHIDPITAGLRLIDAVVVNEAPLVDNLWWFASPVAAALVMGFLVWRSAGNVELEPRS